MNRVDNYSLLLLAGGKSSRMGRNKAELQYEGKTFVQQMVLKARRLGIRHIYISGFSEEMDDVTIVWDQFHDRGPLGGLHACMKKIHTPFCLVLPIDAPKLPQTVLEELLDWHEHHRSALQGGKEIPLTWVHGDRIEPLIAVYPVVMADAIAEMIREGAAPVFRMLDFWGYEQWRRELEKPQVINVNTPELYQELLSEEQNGQTQTENR